jgi:rhodanese-related sulfurtransferase
MLGDKKIKALATPGHTDSCMSFVFEDMVFTGDALLIRGTGRTDFQQGSSEKLYKSITEQLFTLPGHTKVYPGHDYRGHTASTIDLEKKFNPRIGGGKTMEEFKKIMSELKLANPKKIHEAVPANMACGKLQDARTLHPQMIDGVPEVTPEEVWNHRSKLKLIDVRGPDEFHGELGHVPGSKMIVLGDELVKFLQAGDKTEEIVFICRSGARSGRSTLAAREMGYKFVANMSGGMIRWNELKLPTEK